MLEITSIVALGNDGGLAYIRYNDDVSEVSLDEVVVGVGDRLKFPYDEEPFDSEVLAIQPGKVLFRWGGKEHLLQPPTVNGSTGPSFG